MLTMLLDQHMSPLSLRQAQFVITTNPSLVPAAFRHKAVQVSWGANTQRFRAGLSGSEARRRFGLTERDYVIGYTGTFRPWHGLDVLPDVAERLQDPSVKFLLIGELSRTKQLRDCIRQRGLQASFVFTDRVPYDEVPSTLAAADLCIAPFDPERHQGANPGLVTTAPEQAVYTLDPLKVFEYLALEKPVVTVATDNIERLFQDSVHLRMVPPRDAIALARVIGELRHDPPAARRMAAAGRQRVVERHTWSAHATHLATLFEKMLS
jgi:glycosyltransferase involved in cell wall biosynthesis